LETSSAGSVGAVVVAMTPSSMNPLPAF
jgi:hypothetical protein